MAIGAEPAGKNITALTGGWLSDLIAAAEAEAEALDGGDGWDDYEDPMRNVCM